MLRNLSSQKSSRGVATVLAVMGVITVIDRMYVHSCLGNTQRCFTEVLYDIQVSHCIATNGLLRIQHGFASAEVFHTLRGPCVIS